MSQIDFSTTADLANFIESTPKRAELCHEVAQALIEVGEPLMSDPGFWGLFTQTDYEKLCTELVQDLEHARNFVRHLRSEGPTASLIRSESVIDKTLRCCKNCKQANASRMNRGKPFVCWLIEEQEQGQDVGSGVRFSITPNGDIQDHG